MCKENKTNVNYLGVSLFNTSLRYRSTRNKIYVHETLKFKCEKPSILHEFSGKFVNCKISLPFWSFNVW